MTDAQGNTRMLEICEKGRKQIAVKNVDKQRMVSQPLVAPQATPAGVGTMTAVMDGNGMLQKMEDMMRQMTANMTQMENMVASVKTQMQAAAALPSPEAVDAEMVRPANLDGKLEEAVEKKSDAENNKEGGGRGQSRTPRRAWHGSSPGAGGAKSR